MGEFLEFLMKVDWGQFVFDFKVQGEKTEILSSSRTSQSVRKTGKQTQCVFDGWVRHRTFVCKHFYDIYATYLYFGEQ